VWLQARVPAQFHPGWADGLGHVFHVVAGAEFVLKPRDELLASGYNHLGVVFRVKAPAAGQSDSTAAKCASHRAMSE
jgi:hypothetical protein